MTDAGNNDSGDRGRDDRAGAPVKRPRHTDSRRFWYDFIRFNLTGWSVALPALAGLFVGSWIDNRWPGPVSWKLALMLAGLMLGCINAWYWIRRKDGR